MLRWYACAGQNGSLYYIYWTTGATVRAPAIFPFTQASSAEVKFEGEDEQGLIESGMMFEGCLSRT